MSGELRDYVPNQLLATFSLVQAIPGFDVNDINLREGLVKAPHIAGGRRVDTWALEKDGNDNGLYTKIGGKGVDSSGSLAFTYMQGAVTNRYLSTILNADEATSLAIGTIQIKDLNGDSLVIGRGCRIQGFPGTEWAQGGGTNRIWNFLCNQLEVFIGAATLVG